MSNVQIAALAVALTLIGLLIKVGMQLGSLLVRLDTVIKAHEETRADVEALTKVTQTLSTRAEVADLKVSQLVAKAGL